MDTELEFVAERLKGFRDKVKAARAAADLIDLIDKSLLTAAGWKVHADSQSFIGASRVDQHGIEWEIRVGRTNRTIGGMFTPKRHPAKQSRIDSFKMMMTDAFRPPPHPTVRRHIIEEVDWRAICQQI